MEKMIKIHLEKLPEGLYLATSDDIQGLVAQGRTVSETIEIARDVARKLIEVSKAYRPLYNYPKSHRRHAPGYSRAILKQAGISAEDFINMKHS
jgi:predicted RNase H-like HicB family nuclease